MKSVIDVYRDAVHTREVVQARMTSDQTLLEEAERVITALSVYLPQVVVND